VRIGSVVPTDVEPAGTHPAVQRFRLPVLRLAGGSLVLVLLARQGGVGPFHAGLRAVTWPLVLAAVALTAMTTVCSAWRWRVVAQALGVRLALPAAVGAYYRSQFLNMVLPGAVLGDVHRAVAHGRHAGDLARGLRAVGYERLFGQVVQALVTAVVLLILPSPVRPALPYLIAGAGAAGCAALTVRAARRAGSPAADRAGLPAAGRVRSRPTRAARAVIDDVRGGLLAREVWPQLTLSSLLVVAGHTTTFVLAARVAGSTAPLGELVALLMLVQTAAGVPFSVGGWGPREGAAAWAFAAAGLGAATGVTVTTLYAVIAVVAVTPGMGLLLYDLIGRGRRGTVAGDSTPAGLARAEQRELEAIRG
jgi:uncharacterized membrane protein YbhN (UPF0104 family)